MEHPVVLRHRLSDPLYSLESEGEKQVHSTGGGPYTGAGRIGIVKSPSHCRIPLGAGACAVRSRSFRQPRRVTVLRDIEFTKKYDKGLNTTQTFFRFVAHW